MSLDKSFDPGAVEQRWYRRWEDAGWFAAGAEPGKPAFCIQLPPPNVTGVLHMGHAFNQTIMDALTRYHRMRGDNTLWLPGTDHAGIATQIVVERQLEQQGASRHELGREDFIAKVWEWKARSGSTITEQMRRMGDSCDWSREYFTMDEKLSRVVVETFVRLHEQGLIYRGKRLVNWDPVLLTAVSDLEVESEEEDGQLWHIRYPGDGFSLTVATTRPETLLGDVAVMVHPEDERYRAFVGREVELPLTGRRIPVIADEYVDREFGTGCVKVTPAHDFNDYQVGQRHGLPQIEVLTLDARINDNGPEKYRGLDRYEARERIVHDLKAAGLLESVKPHRMVVPRCGRTGAAVEPMLTDQWFVAMSKPGAEGKSIAQRAIEVVQQGEVKFYPENWLSTYYQWMNNIQDWCISRQLWWGHQIPAWYDDDGKIYVARSEEEASEAIFGKTPEARPGRARHLVLLGAGVPLDARLARAAGRGQARLRALPALLGAGDRLRDHLLLGRAHDHDDDLVHRPGAVPRRLHPRHRARPRRQEDVEVRGQHDRPGRPDRRHRPRRAAREAHHRAAQARKRRPRSAPARRRNSRTAFPPSAPTRCASPWPPTRPSGATSTSTSSAARATATSATSCGTRPASC